MSSEDTEVFNMRSLVKTLNEEDSSCDDNGSTHVDSHDCPEDKGVTRDNQYVAKEKDIRDLLKKVKPRTVKTIIFGLESNNNSINDSACGREYMSKDEELYRDHTWRKQYVSFDEDTFNTHKVMVFEDEEIFSCTVQELSIDEFITQTAGVFTRFMKAKRTRDPTSVIPHSYVRECMDAASNKDMIWDIYVNVEKALDTQGYDFIPLNQQSFALAISQGREVFIEQCWWITLHLQRASVQHFANVSMKERSIAVSEPLEGDVYSKRVMRRWSSTSDLKKHETQSEENYNPVTTSNTSTAKKNVTIKDVKDTIETPKADGRIKYQNERMYGKRAVVSMKSSESSSSMSEECEELQTKYRREYTPIRKRTIGHAHISHTDTSSDEEYVPRGYVPLDSQAAFDGKEGEEVARGWLKMFEYNADAMGKQKRHRCSHMKLLLKGSAIHWYNSLPVETQHHWKKLRDAFDTRFCRTKTDAAELYWSAYRNSGEDAVEYFWRLNSLARRARIDYNRTPEAEKKHIMHYASTMGECVDKRRIAMMKSVDSLSTFLDDMIELENREKRMKLKLGHSPHISNNRFQSRNSGMVTRNVKHVNFVGVTQTPRSHAALSREDVETSESDVDVCRVCFTRTEQPTCSKCGRKHRDEDCWKDIQCTACKVIGHPENRCHKKCKLCKTIHANPGVCEVYAKFIKLKDHLQKKGETEYIPGIDGILNEYARLQ